MFSSHVFSSVVSQIQRSLSTRIVSRGLLDDADPAAHDEVAPEVSESHRSVANSLYRR